MDSNADTYRMNIGRGEGWMGRERSRREEDRSEEEEMGIRK